MPLLTTHRFLVLVLATLTVAGLLLLMPAAMPGPDRTVPNAALAPDEVVHLQLEALQHNDKPTKDHGIAVAYRFASPENRAKSGSLSHFAAMVHAGYADMLNFNKAVYLPVLRRNSIAFQPVILFSDFGTSRYVFILSRHDGEPCPQCWLTDAVIKLQPKSDLGMPI